MSQLFSGKDMIQPPSTEPFRCGLGLFGWGWGIKKDPTLVVESLVLWALTDSNRRPSACKADALNQLS